MKLKLNKTYIVNVDASYLWRYVYGGPNTEMSRTYRLKKGDRIIYTGHRYSGGSDGINIPYFKVWPLISSDFEGAWSGEVWGNIPQGTLIEAISLAKTK